MVVYQQENYSQIETESLEKSDIILLVIPCLHYYNCSCKFQKCHKTVNCARHVWPIMLYLPKFTCVQVNGRVVCRKKVSVISARYPSSGCLAITCEVNNKCQTELHSASHYRPLPIQLNLC